MGNAGWLIGLAVVGLVVGVQGLRVVQEYERGIVFRFGRLAGVRGPGLRLLVPFVDRMVKVSLRLAVLDVPKQDVITRDNVPVRVNAVVFFQVEDAVQAVIEVANYTQATSQKAQTTLRSVLGECELDELLASREKINQELRVIIDRETERWGVRIRGVEVKDVELPEEMQRAMARQAEAERERRAKVIAAQGEYEAAERLAEAARVIGGDKVAVQLRFLQSLAEIAVGQGTMAVLPIPIELFGPLLERRGRDERTEGE